MSTLTVTNIKATGETASREVSGIAGAWVNFDGTGTIAVRTSFNVSSLTDQSTGDYLVNLTNAFSAESAFVANGGNAGRPGNATGNTSSIRVYCSAISNDAAQDTSIVTMQANGDLA